jgi:biotin carboxyl carrier protein
MKNILKVYNTLLFLAMPTARVNNRNFQVELKENEVLLDGKPLQWDISRLNDRCYHIIYQQKSYLAEVISINRQAKTVSLKINQSTFQVELKDKLDELLEKMGMQAASQRTDTLLRAPMPGLIVDVRVKEGDEVQAGDALLILEAMKMENAMKAPAAGKVKAVYVKPKDNVEKGQLLIEMH